MGKAWIGVGARVVVEFTLSLFAGLEAVEGWILGNPVAFLASFAGWPLYTAMTFFAVGMFVLGCIHLHEVSRQNLARRSRIRRDALVQTVEELVELHRPDRLAGPTDMERLSLIELGDRKLARFGLSAPDDLDDAGIVMYYQRLLPYLRLNVSAARKAARSWKRRLDR